MLQILRGVNFLHQNGIIHRDLKPGEGIYAVFHSVKKGRRRAQAKFDADYQNVMHLTGISGGRDCCVV